MVAVGLTKAVIAATRFGFTARPGDLAAIASDPQGWVLGQLDDTAGPIGAGGLPDSASMVSAMLAARRDPSEDGKTQYNERLRAVYLAEIAARHGAAVTSETPLLERLTRFWSNHFTVSCLRPMIRGFAGAFEREAIRPHVTGRFADLLLAAERHPAMLFYLDQVTSVGPNSLVGLRQGKGLNENLGRELLELHTLGVDGGYSQDDVTTLARILTGWSIARLNDPEAGHFRFYPQIHEPGTKRLLGKTYREDGYTEGLAALRDLAIHPATARHIATKLARYFIADRPPPDAVQRIALVFTDTGGDLERVTAAVVGEDLAWHAPFAKIRDPEDLVVAACRATGFAPPPEMLAQSERLLDQPCYFAPSPAGWPDQAGDWIGPESVLHRAEWCEIVARRIPDPPDPIALAAATFGDTLREETIGAITRAPSRREALALLLASPEFQRR